MQRTSAFIHELFQVFIQVFEYERKRFFGMNDIMKGNCKKFSLQINGLVPQTKKKFMGFRI